MIVRPYRLYHLDAAGRILSAENFDAADDDRAIEHARASQREDAPMFEVWQLGRLVFRGEYDLAATGNSEGERGSIDCVET